MQIGQAVRSGGEFDLPGMFAAQAAPHVVPSRPRGHRPAVDLQKRSIGRSGVKGISPRPDDMQHPFKEMQTAEISGERIPAGVDPLFDRAADRHTGIQQFFQLLPGVGAAIFDPVDAAEHTGGGLPAARGIGRLLPLDETQPLAGAGIKGEAQQRTVPFQHSGRNLPPVRADQPELRFVEMAFGLDQQLGRGGIPRPRHRHVTFRRSGCRYYKKHQAGGQSRRVFALISTLQHAVLRNHRKYNRSDVRQFQMKLMFFPLHFGNSRSGTVRGNTCESIMRGKAVCFSRQPEYIIGHSGMPEKI